ncbi:MAG: PD40 domain-containing protein [Anaerolineales bacterium]|nr:PD40 domain-containing protein [Anaerolineales bacterium]
MSKAIPPFTFLFPLLILLSACQAAATPLPPAASPTANETPTASRTAEPTATERLTSTSSRTSAPTAVRTKRPSPTPTEDALKDLGKIAFFKNDGLYTMRADGSELTLVAELDGIPQGVSWSPDGKRIAYAVDWKIGIANANGSGFVKITGEGDHVEPDWSPDGEWLVYTSDQSMRADPNGPFWYTDLFLMRPDGTDARNLSPALPINSDSPDWSPSGVWIAFWYGGPVYLMDPASGAMNPLVPEPACDLFNPVWSPDGMRIAYEKNCSGRSQIFIIPVEDPNSKTALTGVPGGKNFGASNPTWSPDGRFIAYQQDYKICIQEVGAAASRCLTDGVQPDWSWAVG